MLFAILTFIGVRDAWLDVYTISEIVRQNADWRVREDCVAKYSRGIN